MVLMAIGEQKQKRLIPKNHIQEIEQEQQDVSSETNGVAEDSFQAE